MDESGEGQPQNQINEESNQPENVGRRAFLKGLFRGAAGIVAAKVVGASDDGKDDQLPQVTQSSSSGSTIPRELDHLPEAGLVVLATKQSRKNQNPEQKREDKPSFLDKKITRREAIIEGSKVIAGLSAASLAVAEGVNLAKDRKIGKDSRAEDAQLKDTNEKLEDIPTGIVFSEMFPDLSKKEKRTLLDEISSYKKTTQEGGIGTLEANGTMGELLVREYKSLNFERVLQEEALKNGLNPNIVKGMIFIESHGRTSVESRADAVGISQLKIQAAENYGLIVRNEKGVIVEDYRDNPFMSIRAQCEYLKDLRDQYGGNMGIAVWAYHAGDGNMYGILSSYFKDAAGVDIEDLDEVWPIRNTKEGNARLKAIFDSTKFLVRSKNVNVYDIRQNAAVKKFIKDKELKDDTVNYAIKAAAAAEYFEESPLGLPISKAA